MNSTFSLKSSIALLVLGVAVIATPKTPAKSAVSILIAQQPTIASSIIGLGSSNV